MLSYVRRLSCHGFPPSFHEKVRKLSKVKQHRFPPHSLTVCDSCPPKVISMYTLRCYKSLNKQTNTNTTLSPSTQKHLKITKGFTLPLVFKSHNYRPHNILLPNFQSSARLSYEFLGCANCRHLLCSPDVSSVTDMGYNRHQAFPRNTKKGHATTEECGRHM
jgi:hypothetical protein